MLFRLRKPTWYDLWQAAERGGRVFAGAFIALYPLGIVASSITHWATGSDIAIVDVDLAKKATAAGIIALTQFGWRFVFPDVARSKPELTATGVEVVSHPHGSDVATEA